jgi:glycosyltransferase involved in cell wall biosynthesis
LKVKRFCRDYRPDIIHGQGIGLPGDFATRLGAPSVVSVHGIVHREARMTLSASLPDRWRVRLAEGMSRRILRRARVVISTSAYDLHSLKDWVAGRHILIANPVDAAFFASGPVIPEAQTILFAGMMIPRKNVTGLLRAFDKVRGRVPSTRLVIVGPTPEAEYADEVRALVRQLDLQDAVEFRGFLENPELVACLAQSRCLVLFSNEETSPTVIAQAMAMGKPIVATRVGGIPELALEGKGGFLVDAGDEASLSERLICVLTSDDLVREMGAYNRQAAVTRSSPDEVARRTIEAYRLALGNHR